MASRLFVALDVEQESVASDLAIRLAPYGVRFKIGLEWFCRFGPAGVERLRPLTGPVLLDLKLHDIPRTVAAAVAAIRPLGVWGVTLHSSGGPAMLRAAVAAADGAMRCLGVTVLTSIAARDLGAVGWLGSVADQVQRLASLARDSGCDGVVASAQEAAMLRAALGPEHLVVTPGVRLAGAGADDQARRSTPGEAIAAGADFLVVGRPIVAAPDPEGALRRVLVDMAAVSSADRR